MDTPRFRPLPILGALVVLIAAALIIVTVSRAGTPGDISAEAGFSRDMAVHHAQAVDMSFVARDASSDQDLRTFAYDIINTQSTQRGIFMGWLDQWGLPQTSTQPAMTWMSGHGHSGTPGVMPGMASPEEMRKLRAATGVAGEVLFLQLMIRHHEGGVDMARGVLKLTSRSEVRTMAQHIVDGQTAEINLMKDMLAKRGGQPLPSILK
ncbi:DUF305 domain-containing protein [Acrocarpospora phusangensis]|uniref:DUF305 domain-containing protein n=1 Tax=Acrocarpospora phusangensis TaxID=1070424 RepID=A0A919UL34_9ACTN|nr:DUF305 domain-containing protein [Acrocarpospora phusangensis]GIH25609.1 DUF305 domain-containing protein [Acrocarpospora phusangensis]